MKTIYKVQYEDDCRDGDSRGDFDDGLVVECFGNAYIAADEATNDLWSDSAGEGFDHSGMTPTRLRVTNLDTGEVDKFDVTVDFAPTFYLARVLPEEPQTPPCEDESCAEPNAVPRNEVERRDNPITTPDATDGETP